MSDEFDPAALRGPDHQIQRLTTHEATTGESERQRQDFTAGSVFAHGAGAMMPGGPTDPAPAAASRLTPVFIVFIHEDQRSFGPAPQLERLLARLVQDWEALGAELSADAVWSILHSPTETLLKLRVTVEAPADCAGGFEVLLAAEAYADQWQYIVDGGMLAISSMARINAAMDRPGATFGDGLSQCILLTTGHSPAIETAIAMNGWPR